MEAFSQLAHGIDWSSLRDVVMQVVAVLICLVVHEVCHGLAAYRLGDPTAKSQHRLSLDPLRHLDVFGTIMMLVVGFGWARPVPVDPRYFRDPKRGMALTALAGPAANLVLAELSALFVNGIYGAILVRGQSGLLVGGLRFFYLLMLLNIGLGIFNLIPFPPLDGSKVVAMFLSDRAYYRWMQLERYGMIVLMAVLWFGWLDGFLYAARQVVENAMLDGSAFMTTLVVKLLS